MTDYFIQVGDYKEGRLGDSAKQAFETEMSTNDELKRAVDNYDVMDMALDMLWEDDARAVAIAANNAIRETDTGLESSQKKEAKVMPMKRMMAVAASLLVLVAAGFLLMQNLGTPSEELYAEFYSPYMGDQTRGGDNNSTLELCEQGHVLMDKQQFSKAIDVFKQSIQENEDCKQKSEWYLMLCYLSQNKIEERDSLLNVIKSNVNHKHHSAAEDLIKKL